MDCNEGEFPNTLNMQQIINDHNQMEEGDGNSKEKEGAMCVLSTCSSI